MKRIFKEIAWGYRSRQRHIGNYRLFWFEGEGSAVVALADWRSPIGPLLLGIYAELATDFWHQFDLPIESTTWIRYQATEWKEDVTTGERFDWVHMALDQGQLQHAIWEPTTRDAVEALIGQSFPR